MSELKRASFSLNDSLLQAFLAKCKLLKLDGEGVLRALVKEFTEESNLRAAQIKTQKAYWLDGSVSK